jgi:cytochrome c
LISNHRDFDHDGGLMAISRVMSGLIALALVGGLVSLKGGAETSGNPRFSILVFSKTTGYRHDSIPDGIAAIRALGAEHGFLVDASEDAGRFTDAGLAPYQAVVFLSTTGDILDVDQKAVFERYIRSGHGFVGIHSASDTEYHWPWYGRLVGAYFKSHPAIQPATVRITDPEHASTVGLAQNWQRTDEWYNFRSNPRDTAHVLATIDESTYTGGTMGADHPIAWCQTIDVGRSWYTAMGHTKESYAEPLFRRHLLGGIESAAGVAGDCGGG